MRRWGRTDMALFPLKGLTDTHKDFLRVVGFGLGYLPTALIPRRLDSWAIQNLISLALKLRPEKATQFAARMSEPLGPEAEGRDLTPEARHRYEMVLENTWGRVRSLHRDGWRPEVTLEGLERIEAGLAGGHGTVLWRTSMGNSLIAKKALWAAGVPLVHLSLATHGAWSSSWIGENWIAPLFRRTEGWYLRERVIIQKGRSRSGIMKTLLTRLSKENAVVSIFGDLSAPQNIRTPFFDREAAFAMGSPSLAWKAGSALLPVYCIRECTGKYRVVVDEPISVDREMGRKEYVREAVGEFSQRLQDRIVQHPGSWSGWSQYWTRNGIFAPEVIGPSSTDVP